MILHPQLEKDCFVIGRLPLCALLLTNDANYPWFILVPQLHIHHIVRYKTDPAWPAPVWGAASARQYSKVDAKDIQGRLQDLLF